MQRSLRRPTSFVLRLLLLFCVAGLIAACVGAPVQEMSNARQAVRAAERAGAAEQAPELLAEAKQALEEAVGHLRLGEYRIARTEAETARAKAVEARRGAELANNPSPAPSEP